MPFIFVGTAESIANAKVLLEYHLASLKVRFRVGDAFDVIRKYSFLKEFDELQEKKIQVNEQFRTIVGPQQGTSMSITAAMGYQGGRPQRYESIRLIFRDNRTK